VPLLLDYLTVYGAMLETIDSLMLTIEASSESQLCERVFRHDAPSESRREILSYALQVGILNTVPSNLHPASGNQTLLRGRSDRTFPLEVFLLRHFHTCNEPNHVHRNLYLFLLRALETDSVFVQRDDVWPLYNTHPSSERSVFNSPRMASWLRIYTYIGLVSPERSNVFTVTPTLKLVRMLVRCLGVHGAHLVTAGSVRLPDFVKFVETGFCPMTDRRGRVHRGWVDAITALAALGELELAVVGDAPTVFLGTRAYSHVVFPSALQTVGRESA